MKLKCANCFPVCFNFAFKFNLRRYVSGVRVTRVTRIHNRHLRNRFEQRLESLVDMSDPAYKRSLEYLFAGDCPARAYTRPLFGST